MKNTFGNVITVTLFGESHGPAIGACLDGLSPGIKIDHEYIKHRLDLRRPYGSISTKRREADEYEIVSGVFNGYTTGTPLTIVIRNKDTKSADYSEMSSVARPAHADLTAQYKYGGFSDYRGGGHFSGRITAALVAAGAIAQNALEEKGILIGTHIRSCYNIEDRTFEDMEKDIVTLNDSLFPVLDSESEKKMIDAITAASEEGDSLGGVLETAITGVSSGVGEPWFDSCESCLAHGIFSIPAVKGIEFGKGFELTKMKGSSANDKLRYIDGKIAATANNSGGIDGGITNGMPIIFRTAVKPTPSIFKAQDSVDFLRHENAKLQLRGRHDPAIVHRARAVVDAVSALTIADLLCLRYGTDYLRS